jgi:hypothetical protein
VAGRTDLGVEAVGFAEPPVSLLRIAAALGQASAHLLRLLLEKKTWLSVALVAVASLARVGATFPSRGEDRFVEQLDPETAYSEIAKSKGVILVDLYAEW